MLPKTEMLFIRARKSANPAKRLQSVYRRFYGNYDYNPWYVVGILISIVEKYFPIDLLHVFSSLNVDNSIAFRGVKNAYALNALHILYNHIRFLEVSKLPEDFIKPICFRRNDV